MQWWLILILAIIILVILASLHPIRLWVEGSADDKLNLKIVLKPFGIFPGKIKIVNIENKPWSGEQETAPKEAKKKSKLQLWLEQRLDKLKDKKDGKDTEQENEEEKKNFAEKLPFDKADILPIVDKMLGSLQVEDLDLEANLSGDPYHSGVACGVLWTLFGGGFAYLSHRVKKFTKKPVMNFGVDLERPWSAYLRLQVMVRVGDLGGLGIKVLAAIIKNRKQNRLNNKTAKAAE